MKNKLIKVFFLCVAVFLLLPLSSFAADEISVFVNDSKIQFDVNPQIISDRTMIPFRYVANAFNATVDYNEVNGEKIVTASVDGMTMYMTIGKTEVFVEENGQKSQIVSDVAPVIVDSRTLVPVRLVAETFGCAVGWNGDMKQVIIVTPDKIIDKIYATKSGIYSKVLEPDIESFTGEYSLVFNSGDKKISASLFIDEKAVACNIFTNEGVVELVTTDELIYTRNNSTHDADWNVLTLSEFAKIYPITDIDSIIMNLIVSVFIENYVEKNPTDSTFSKLDTMFSAVCSDDAIKISGDGKNYIAELDTGDLTTDPQMYMKIKTTVENMQFKSMEISSHNEYTEFNLIISQISSSAEPKIPIIK